MLFLEKTMENVRKDKVEEDTTFHTTKFFTEILLAIEMKKNRDTYELACLVRTFNTRTK